MTRKLNVRLLMSAATEWKSLRWRYLSCITCRFIDIQFKTHIQSQTVEVFTDVVICGRDQLFAINIFWLSNLRFLFVFFPISGLPLQLLSYNADSFFSLSTYPALLLLLFVFGVLAQTAHAGVTGCAVDAGHTFWGVLPSNPQVWKWQTKLPLVR